MTFTRHTPGGPPAKAAPVTLARVAAALGAAGYVTRTEPDAVRGRWDGFEVEISIEHEHVVLAGTWSHHVPEHMRGALYVSLNDWNKGRWWPAAATVEEEDGITVRTRFVLDARHGLSNEQLLGGLEAGLRATVDMLTFLGTPRPAHGEE